MLVVMSILVGILIAIVIGLVVWVVYMNKLNRQVEDYMKDIEQLESRIDDIEQAICECADKNAKMGFR